MDKDGNPFLISDGAGGSNANKSVDVRIRVVHCPRKSGNFRDFLKIPRPVP
uniref:Uncharacterized protein n=1 Tax=Meloidogyne enterolobii TaxID=390850 RepID=A0A6V7W540_MELEN|nr:unnamed protein product [Meloidogyne enterolobii]